MTSPETERLLQRARAEIAAGQPWRARELLRGRITSAREPIPSSVLEAYGDLLDSLGDRVEAGKFLLLSGARTASNSEAVALYLSRTKKASGDVLISQLPKAIQRLGLGHLPPAFRDFLVSRGASRSVVERTEPTVREVPRKGTATSVVLSVTVILVIVLLGVACITGLWVMAEWIF